jgi:glycosyltransferase involved in cell wall biosynthesis
MNSGIENLEIIFVDDGSTDNTVKLIDGFQKADPSIVLLKNAINLGGGAARNRGVHYAKNPLIFILDSDDVLSPSGLSQAIECINKENLDGVATSKSIFFTSRVSEPCNVIEYKSGYTRFEDLVSHVPNPVIGNLLFKKQAFLDIGGYPDHHSFDTQGFGFRLLQNNKKIMVGESVMYFQRLPLTASYYMREARAGNANRNWFYIFYECLYKFSPHIRKLILEFPYADPSLLGKGRHLFNVLADQSSQEDFYCPESVDLDEESAYRKYSGSDDLSLSMWCFGYEIKHQYYDVAFSRMDAIKSFSGSIRLIYPLISNIFGCKFSETDIADFSYFFSEKKTLSWRAGLLRQKLLNRVKMYCKYV